MSTPPQPVPGLSPQERIELMEVYKITFETWRSQVDSYWQRSSYFALFETGAIGGCWILLRGCRLYEQISAVVLTVLGFVLTYVWYQSNDTMHGYVRHWWDSLGIVEMQLQLFPNNFATKLEQQQEDRRRHGEAGISYSKLVQMVPGYLP